ncbi:MAG: helix-turn-helix domain-containing protein, partial [Actinomycetota bacterium]|nr:helix-turn-helix domain-containing protein [Actinomycetota bacterium]
ALSGARTVTAWPAAPRPVLARDLLPERALAGDREARSLLRDDIYAALAQAGPTLLDTLTAYFDSGGTLEGTARALFVHPNTVRYRLRRVTDVCGLSPLVARDAFTLRTALTLGRLGSIQL